MVARFNRKVVQDTVGKIRPYGDRLLVEIIPVRSEFTIPKGFTIYLPPSAAPETEHQRMVAWGIIRGLGNGRFNKKTGGYDPFPKEIQPGVEAIFGKFAGTEVKIEGVEHRLMRLVEILAVGPEPVPEGEEEEEQQ